jgi:hypothetical protein
MDVSQVTVICPQNDGESQTIIDICKRLAVDVRISQQPWGSRLDLEPAENLQNLRQTVVVVEMPSTILEETLAKNGHRVIVVDHHYYPAISLDRRRKESSLEQVAAILGYQLDRKEMGVAINDRDYIFGLLEAGYTADEILEIRRFDLQAQGVSPERFELVRNAMASAPVIQGITILRVPPGHSGFAQDFLVLETPDEVRDLLVLTGVPIIRVQFYGDPEKIQKLADIGEWTGGGKRSKFWGTNNPDVPEIFRRLGLSEVF